MANDLVYAAMLPGKHAVSFLIVGFVNDHVLPGLVAGFLRG